MQWLPARPTSRRKRHGSVAFELLLLLPVFLVILFGFVQLSMTVVAEERLANAAGQGARVASQGGSAADVQTAVENSLGTGPLRDNLQPVVITPADPLSAVSGAPVTVRVEVQACSVIPNFLRLIGYSFGNQLLVGQTVMRKE